MTPFALSALKYGLFALLFALCFGCTSSGNYVYDHVPFNSLGIGVKLLVTR